MRAREEAEHLAVIDSSNTFQPLQLSHLLVKGSIFVQWPFGRSDAPRGPV